ncbi:MAG: response regulator [Burkholderiaceae bacterium]
MQNDTLPIVIRFIGFSQEEDEMLAAMLPIAQDRKIRYARLPEGSLRDPDLFLANGDELKTMVVLADLRPNDVRPALLIGTPDITLPYPCIARPIRWQELFDNLDRLVARRDAILARMPSGAVAIPERRRRERLDLDLTDPAEYRKMRAAASVRGGILVVDRTPAFRDYLADTLAGRDLAVEWTTGAHHALAICNQQPVSVVLIDAATPGIDPYRLCADIRFRMHERRVAVILLTGSRTEYDIERGTAAGCDGFFSKPVLPHQILPMLGKFVDLSR